jgi:hypothetical protein
MFALYNFRSWLSTVPFSETSVKFYQTMGVTFQNILLFVAIIVRGSNPTSLILRELSRKDFVRNIYENNI